MKINLYVGDICRAPADMICVSTNPHLELMAGTGGCVRDRGGWAIQEECQAITARQLEKTGQRWLPKGSVVKTTAGTLPFRGILMCVGIDAFHHSSREGAAECARNALQAAAAETPPVHSIAIPLFASGNGTLDSSESLMGILDALTECKECGEIQQVWIIVYKPDDVPLAERILTERLGAFEIVLEQDR